MGDVRKIYWMTAVVLVLATLVTGLFGWTAIGCPRPPGGDVCWSCLLNSLLETAEGCASPELLKWDEILYRTLLAFFAASPDGNDQNIALRIHRLLGLLTAIVAILSIMAALFHKLLKSVWAWQRSNHQVVIGASPFAADYATRAGPATIFDTEDGLAASIPSNHRLRTLRLADAMGPDVATGASLGRNPRRVIFGDRDTITNVERARIWLSEVPNHRRRNTEVVLRIEDAAIARDLALLSPAFADATQISRSETIARSLVTGIAPAELAVTRRQARVHIMLFGLGSVNLAVAEEVALRCHHPDLLPPCLTIVDCDIDRARARLRAERPGLLNPEFSEGEPPLISWLEVNGLECATTDLAASLATRENELEITAIVVSAGQDTVNAGIAMRLRRLQLTGLMLKAPILVRSDTETSIAPAPVIDLTGDIVPFGGRVLDSADLALEQMFRSLGRATHDLWLGHGTGNGRAWEDLNTVERRASYRAAMFATDLLRAAGLAPDSRKAGLRIEDSGAKAILADHSRLDRLAATEHDRWIAERRSEGFTVTESHRDNEKKRHPLMVPFDALAPEEADKDRANVRAILDYGRKQHLAAPRQAAWRRHIRIGVIGPLTAERRSLEEMADRFARLIEEDGLGEASFEIVTPDAPGTDREGTRYLLKTIKEKTGRGGRVLLLEAASADTIDQIAARHIAGNGTVTDDLLDALAGQRSAMLAAAEGHRRVDCRPRGTSDADLLADHTFYIDLVRTIQNRLIELSDYMVILGGDKEGSLSAEAARQARQGSKRII